MVKSRLLLITVFFVVSSSFAISAMEDSYEASEEIISPESKIYINSIKNETNEVVQVAYDGKKVTSIPAGKMNKVRIPISLAHSANEYGVWITQEEEYGKGLTLWFRPSGAIFYLTVWQYDRIGGADINTTLTQKTADEGETLVALEMLTIPIEKGTEEIQIGIDIILRGDPTQNLEGSEIDIIPILKS